MAREKKVVSLLDMPDYVYPLNIACPSCLGPLFSRKRRDGRCDSCLRNKELLPVNWIRPPKKKSDDEEEVEYAYE